MEYFVVECYCTCILREFKIFFHPAKFDNFKDEKISDFKNVSVSQRKKLAGLKTGGLVGLWATFKGSFSTYFSNCIEKLHKMALIIFFEKLWKTLELSPQNSRFDVLHLLYSGAACIAQLKFLTYAKNIYCHCDISKSPMLVCSNWFLLIFFCSADTKEIKRKYPPFLEDYSYTKDQAAI